MPSGDPEDIQLDSNAPKGFALGCAFTFFYIVILAALGSLVPLIGLPSGLPDSALTGLFFLAMPGAAQWLYLIPLIRMYRRRGEQETAKGLIIQGCLLSILNASCFGLGYSIQR